MNGTALVRLVGWILLACWGAGAAAGAEWRLSSRTIRAEVRTTVAAQVAALQREDFAGAYEHAAEQIRRQFPLPVFAAMIRRGYPGLLRHRAADLGVVRDRAGREAWIHVDVTTADGAQVRYRYDLLREEAGWRVIGVRSEPREAAPEAADPIVSVQVSAWARDCS